jgi:hypothetical protein
VVGVVGVVVVAEGEEGRKTVVGEKVVVVVVLLPQAKAHLDPVASLVTLQKQQRKRARVH